MSLLSKLTKIFILHPVLPLIFALISTEMTTPKFYLNIFIYTQAQKNTFFFFSNEKSFK